MPLVSWFGFIIYFLLMSHTKYQYITPDSHTMIQVEPGEPKVKVSTGEIVAIDDSLYNRGRLVGA